MEPLKETCGELEKVLSHIENDCQVILTSLTGFEDYVGSYAVQRLGRKLQILSCWIIAQAESLYEQHKSQGYVCVFLSEARGINILWVEREEIVADKAWFASYGSTVLSVEKAIDTICQLINDLGSNNWVKVVEWLKTYGKSPGLDFSKFP